MTTKSQSSDIKKTWRYGLMKYKDGSVGVHEIYDGGKSWTLESIIVGDNLNEILEVLKMIKKDIKNYPTINYVQ